MSKLTNNNLKDTIITKLDSLEPSYLELIDESHKHIGHAGVKERGGKHYKLTIASNKFNNLNLLQQHKLIYKTLGQLMGTEIHALKITIKNK